MKSTGSFFSGLLLGAAVGAAIALLYAPEKGDVTRKDIKKKMKELEKELDTLTSKLKEKGGEMKEDVKKRIKEVEDRLSELINQYKKTSEKVKEDVEKVKEDVKDGAKAAAKA
ncbi:MAG TPA: YtxH domain-containing protein [Marinilabiliaceae bacterium]|nr:YtxH domain-containing protein [Marinilabiliaceae bacterium]